MPIVINGQKYYRTTEVCRLVGISRNTLFRWLKDGNVMEVEHRDCRGWRIFTQAQIDAMKKRTGQVTTFYISERQNKPIRLEPIKKAQQKPVRG
ncbi:MAG TPA: MerR family transcriptional regulator [Dehalococcoidia bacterium]|nr:MerR family transcriptional regulator [Dehalococcoidia bacterium]